MRDIRSEETHVRLRRLTLGETTELLTVTAPDFGYSIGATGPRAFRLARVRRKQIVRKFTESIAVALSEDRSGTVVRFVGPIDEALTERLEKADVPLAPQDLRPPLTDRKVAPRIPEVPPTHRLMGGDGRLPDWMSSDSAPAQTAPTMPKAPSLDNEPAPSPSQPERPSAGAFSTAAELKGSTGLDSATVARSQLRGVTNSELVMPDGRTIDLATPVVVGRNPSIERCPERTEPVQLLDKMLSKTHALIEEDDDGVWVTDLHSTNGTSVTAGGLSTQLEPGERGLAAQGSSVLIGDMSLLVRAAR